MIPMTNRRLGLRSRLQCRGATLACAIVVLVVGCEAQEPDAAGEQAAAQQTDDPSALDNRSDDRPLPDQPPELVFDDDGVADYQGVPGRLAPGKYVVLLRGGEHCHTYLAEALEVAFREIAASTEATADFVVADRDEMRVFDATEWPYSSDEPEVLFIEDGEIVDHHRGGELLGEPDHEYNLKYIRHLLARNGLIDASPEEFTYSQNLAEFGFGGGHLVGPVDARGQNLQNIRLPETHFSGTNLKNADLRGAVLDDATFSGVDLTGADLTGASLRGVDWYRTRCPDGTRSANYSANICPEEALER